MVIEIMGIDVPTGGGLPTAGCLARAATSCYTGGAQEAESWLTSPEVSLEDVQASWDAVGRIEQLLQAHHVRTQPSPALLPQLKPLLWAWMGSLCTPAAR